MSDTLLMVGMWALVLVPSGGLGVAVAKAVAAHRRGRRWATAIGVVAGLLAWAACAAATFVFLVWWSCRNSQW